MSSARGRQLRFGGLIDLRQWPRMPSRLHLMWAGLLAVLILLVALLAHRYGLVALAIPPALAMVVLVATQPVLAVALPILVNAYKNVASSSKEAEYEMKQ